MKHSTPKSRRHRNPEQGEKQKEPFFSKKAPEKQAAAESKPFFQTKLKVGAPGDAYEQEADKVADAVSGKSNKAPQVQASGISRIQRYMTNAKEDELGTNTQRIEKDKAIQEKPELQKMEEEEAAQPKGEEEEAAQPKGEEEEESMQAKGEEEEETAQTKEEEEEAAQPKEEEETEAPVQAKAQPGKRGNRAGLKKQLKASRSGGKPLPKTVQSQMENAIGADFSQVRVHTDQRAREMSKGLKAQAFTYGKDVFFNTGKFRPETQEGQHLLAHELTHVVQQGKAGNKSKAPGSPALQRQDDTTPGVKGKAAPLGKLKHTPVTYSGKNPHFDFRVNPKGPLPEVGELEIIHLVYYEPNKALDKEDKKKFAAGFESSVESAWSDKYMFHLKEAGFEEYKMRVKVNVKEVEKPKEAHTRISIKKRPDKSKRFRSGVTDDEKGGRTSHTAELDFRDPFIKEENMLDYNEKIWQVGPFDHDDDQLNSEVMKDIKEVESTLKPLQKPAESYLLLDDRWFVDYVGRATAVGNADYNKKLSKNRANSVVDYLIEHGIGSDRLTHAGYGEEQTIRSDSDIAKMKSRQDKEDAHQENRRTEFKILSL